MLRFSVQDGCGVQVGAAILDNIALLRVYICRFLPGVLEPYPISYDALDDPLAIISLSTAFVKIINVFLEFGQKP